MIAFSPTYPVVQLAIYIGMGSPTVIEPVIRRMLASSEASVRQAGGLLSAYAGWSLACLSCSRRT